jgi:hypothetical protein
MRWSFNGHSIVVDELLDVVVVIWFEVSYTIKNVWSWVLDFGIWDL